MISTPASPLFILAYVADTQGCGYHRIQIPLGALMAAGLAEGRIDMQVMPDHLIQACKPDVIVWQRQIEQGQFETMRRFKKLLPNTFMVYELDDFLAGVPDASYHSGFMPPNIGGAVQEGLLICDAATTTTPAMAEWFREMGCKDVRIIPNLIPMSSLRDREAKSGNKVRIGWAGGISHTGDLSRIMPAMLDIGDEVEWVFLGMKPAGLPDGFKVEFSVGTPPQNYLEAVARLNLDLVLAPLEHNRFNECKSNLRLVEAGAVCAAVIAEDMPSYHDDDPPVFAYAVEPEGWTKSIREFISLPASERQKHARALQRWTSANYTLESRIHARLKAWLPDPNQAYFRPQAATTQHAPYVVSCATGSIGFKLPRGLKNAKIVQGLIPAIQEAQALGADLLWVRPDTTISDGAWENLKLGFSNPQEPISMVLPLATDGPNAFPRTNAYTPLDTPTVKLVGKLCGEILTGVPRLNVYAPGGPAMLISRHALAMFGAPDVEGVGGFEEMALLEWGLRLLPKGWKVVQIPTAFAGSMVQPAPVEPMLHRLEARGMRPVLQIPPDSLPPDKREAMELRLLREQWRGPRPGMAGFRNDYATWAAFKDALRKPTVNHEPGIAFCPFGEFAAVPDAHWVIFTDETMSFTSDALGQFAKKIREVGSDVQAIYADHEVKFPDGQRVPFFKPDLDPVFLLGIDYLTPCIAVRDTLVVRAQEQGISIDSRENLYTALVKLACTAEYPQKTFAHIPEILAQVNHTFTPEMMGVQAVERARRIGCLTDYQFFVNPLLPGALTIKADMRKLRKEAPRVSIILPTKGGGWMLQPCLNTLLKLTTYENFEVLVVHNGEADVPDLGPLASADPRVRWMPWQEPFNFAKMNNWAVKQTTGEFILFLNDDVRVGGGDFLTSMMGWAVNPIYGAIGAHMVYPHGLVQHAGVVAHRGVMFHQHKGIQANSPGYWGTSALTREVSAVTGACMLVKRENFNRVGGFREELSHNYNDIAFCLDLRRRGFRNLVDNSTELLHLEGSSRPAINSPVGYAKLRSEGEYMAAHYAEPDPYWNDNFALAVSVGGMAVQGGNCDILNWGADDAQKGALRVLVVNDTSTPDSRIFARMGKGDIVYTADITGPMLRLTAPAPANVDGWDIRRPETVKLALRALGIEEIELVSLVGQSGPAIPVETMRLLYALDMPITRAMRDEQALCPRLDMTQDGSPCGEGWKKGWEHCQSCINRYGSPFGYVDVQAYQMGWGLLSRKTPS